MSEISQKTKVAIFTAVIIGLAGIGYSIYNFPMRKIREYNKSSRIKKPRKYYRKLKNRKRKLTHKTK